MKTRLKFFAFSPLLLSAFVYSSLNVAGIHLAVARSKSQSATALATHTFNLREETEVGLEIEARSPGASWAREGAEAAAVLISVDGVYNQDLLLWAGDELFQYR
ncbi:MAG: hypothetical protein DMG97_27825, partial [Acidobacteria bacterium]